MTNDDKADLRAIMKHKPHRYTDKEAADVCDCSVATARKYRRAFAKAAS
jgi:hypothetical protein